MDSPARRCHHEFAVPLIWAAVAAMMSPFDGMLDAPFQRAAATASLAGPRSTPASWKKAPLSTSGSDDERVWQWSQNIFGPLAPGGMTAPRSNSPLPEILPGEAGFAQEVVYDPGISQVQTAFVYMSLASV